MKKNKGAGKYDTWITFEKMPNPQPLDSMGAPIGVPVEQFGSWAAFEPIGSDEFHVAHKRHSETTARFRIPYADYKIDPALHQIVMTFDPNTSPPNESRWNILGQYGDKFETAIEVSEIL